MNEKQVRQLLKRINTDRDLERDILEENWKSRDVSKRKSFAARFPHYSVALNARLTLSHEELLRYAFKVSKSASAQQFANAFICASNPLRPSRQRWAGALRSLSLIYRLPKHEFIPTPELRDCCQVCRCGRVEAWNPYARLPALLEGFTGYPFEVLTHSVAVDYFNLTDLPVIGSPDLNAFKSVLRLIADAPDKATARQVVNKVESHGFSIDIETLGFTGILNCPDYPYVFESWAKPEEFQQPCNTEMTLPACRWKRSMGFDRKKFKGLFPEVPLPRRLG